VVGVRGPHLVPLCHETYARSFPRVGIVRFRAPAFTAFSILRLEHGRLGQSSLPAGKLEAKSSESKRIGPRVGVRGPHLVPLCPETYARSFPIVGIVRFAHAHWSPLPRDLCQIISNSRDCALRAAAFTALNQPSLPRMGLAFIGIACGRFSEYNILMSLHRSLRSGGSTAAKRNVLKRFERVTLLKKRGQWKAGMKSTGLPKTKPE